MRTKENTMSTQDSSYQITLADLQAALHRKDPGLIQQLIQFLYQQDPVLADHAPEQDINFDTLRNQVLFGYELRQQAPGEERKIYRQKQWESFLQQSSGIPARLQLDTWVLELYQTTGEWSRQTLLTLIAEIPLKWGPWKGLKQIFKQAEERNDFEMLGAIAVRCDVENADQHAHFKGLDVTNLTLGYLRRRGWRYLRYLASSLPDLFPHAAIQFLRWYPKRDEGWSQNQLWTKIWIANHLFFHEHKKKNGSRYFNRSRFSYDTYRNTMPSSLSKYRAFPQLWNHTPEPLLDLLLLCQSDKVAQFAIDLLREQFASHIRQIPLAQIIRLGQRPMTSLQRFVQAWIEDNPSLQKAQFKDLGLHDLLLNFLLWSDDSDVRKFAITYARDYAKDLPISSLIRIFQTHHDDLHQLARQILTDRDPREDIGLEHLQTLITLDACSELAKKKLEAGFRPAEIPPDWFKPLLFHDSWDVVDYAVKFLEKSYPSQQLDILWFQELLEDPRIESADYSYLVHDYIEKNIQKRVKQLSTDWIQQALLHEQTSPTIWTLLDDGKISPDRMDLSWLKALTSPQAWEQHPWVQAQKKIEKRWLKTLDYPYHLEPQIITYLTQTKNFPPQTLGLDWLFSLLQSHEEDYVETATHYLMDNFHPGDFARPEDLVSTPTPTQATPVAPKESPFANKSILFTGKLRALTREDAQQRVLDLGGTLAKSVTKTLDFLVVGDEGSPLFSGGEKGSKLVKAEKLQTEGSALRIISETEWLGMMSEGSAAQTHVDVPRVSAGFQRLYHWAIDEQSPKAIRDFASQYMQERHPQLGATKRGKPLPGEAVIPRDLYTVDLFLPLFADERPELQTLAVNIARHDLRRWQVKPAQIFVLCENPHRTVRQFATEALLGPKPGEHTEPFHFKPEELQSTLVFALCESRRKEIRHTGMTLLQRHYDQLHGDEHILRLAESPDRDIRTQAVRILWMRYRRPSISETWAPTKDKRSSIPPRAPMTGTDPSLLIQFAKMVLFGLPPGKSEKRPAGATKPWSNSKAKVHMIQTLRDLALEDQPFAQSFLPLLQEFLASQHKMEVLGSLTALTQIQQRWLSPA